MSERQQRHPVGTAPGALAVATWTVYGILAALEGPDIRASVLTVALAGAFAWLAVVVNFGRWRFVVIAASAVHLVFYVAQIYRMLSMVPSAGLSSLPSTLQFYFFSLWQVTVGKFEERGLAASLAHGFVEYAMPVLSLLLIALAVLSLRAARAAARTG
jgi:hypothetical protein